MPAPADTSGEATSPSAHSQAVDAWRWSATIHAGDRAPRAARKAVDQACADRCDAATMVDLRIVVSELVTNCIEHGHADTVRLCLAGVGDRTTVTVASAASLAGVPPPEAWCLPTATACSGRGLAMVGLIGCAGLWPNCADDDTWSAISVLVEPRPD